METRRVFEAAARGFVGSSSRPTCAARPQHLNGAASLSALFCRAVPKRSAFSRAFFAVALALFERFLPDAEVKASSHVLWAASASSARTQQATYAATQASNAFDFSDNSIVFCASANFFAWSWASFFF